MKIDYRKLNQKSHKKIRIQAVKLLRKKSQILLKWWCLYKTNGVAGMLIKSRAIFIHQLYCTNSIDFTFSVSFSGEIMTQKISV